MPAKRRHVRTKRDSHGNWIVDDGRVTYRQALRRGWVKARHRGGDAGADGVERSPTPPQPAARPKATFGQRATQSLALRLNPKEK